MSNNKDLALHRARELSIDEAVRTIARESYYSHSSFVNYYAKFENLDISATFGAGTNSAVVSVDDGSNMAGPENTLYRASEYGQFVSVFRYGPWAHRLIDEAERLKALSEVEKLLIRLYDDQREADNYREVDL